MEIIVLQEHHHNDELLLSAKRKAIEMKHFNLIEIEKGPKVQNEITHMTLL